MLIKNNFYVIISLLFMLILMISQKQIDSLYTKTGVNLQNIQILYLKFHFVIIDYRLSFFVSILRKFLNNLKKLPEEWTYVLYVLSENGLKKYTSNVRSKYGRVQP